MGDRAARAAGLQVANVCWWYAMGATTDLTVTPRPIYHADGTKEPDCYTWPPALHDRLTGALGEFPLFTYWGPTADITSSRWIAQAARKLLRRGAARPAARLPAAPRLRPPALRPRRARVRRGGRASSTTSLGDLVDARAGRGDTVVVLSEYGITDARRPVDVNRALRRAGLLEVYTQAGMEYLDPWTSRAFAVADHQIAHVYVRDPADVRRGARGARRPAAGSTSSLEGDERRDAGLGHERAGELVLVAEPDAWFTYYYWLDDERAPDFARQVEIHRKPGYDPAELFMDPADRLVKARAGAALVRKKLGMRYVMEVVPLDPSVRARHARPAARRRARRARVPVLGRRRSRATGSPPPTCATSCSSSAGSARRWRPRPAPAPTTSERRLGVVPARARRSRRPRGGARTQHAPANQAVVLR